MTFVLIASLVWSFTAVPVALLVGRGMRLADQREPDPFRIDGVEQYLSEQAPAPRV